MDRKGFTNTEQVDRLTVGMAAGCLKIDYPEGCRVKVDPATDAFMRGIRYAKVIGYSVTIDRTRLVVECERTGVRVDLPTIDVTRMN